jgi:hypothetical protein
MFEFWIGFIVGVLAVFALYELLFWMLGEN